MRKLYSAIILLLLTLLVVGCSDIGGDNPIVEEIPQVNQDPTDEKPNDQEVPAEQTVSENTEKIVTNGVFKEFFPDIIFTDPQLFIQQLVPGFKLGLSKQEVENLIGIPKQTNSYNNGWEDREDWLYDEVRDYAVLLTFDSFNHVVNFQISKELPGLGLVPKAPNKYKPVDEGKITYEELGFEEILVGTTLAEVIERLGEPVQGFISYDEMYGYDLGIVYQGITLHVLLEKELHYIQFIETNSLGSPETYRGIKVGSSVDAVIEKYGNPPYERADDDDLIYATEDYWFAIKFQVYEGKVVAISIYEAS